MAKISHENEAEHAQETESGEKPGLNIRATDLGSDPEIATVYVDHLSASIHESMEDLVALGFVERQEMRAVDATCLTKAPPFTSEQLKALRDREHASQAVLARYLGVSVNTVSQWERGERRVIGTAAKLLELVEKHGLAYIR